MWRIVDTIAIATKITPSDIIDENENDIGPLGAWLVGFSASGETKSPCHRHPSDWSAAQHALLRKGRSMRVGLDFALKSQSKTWSIYSINA